MIIGFALARLGGNVGVIDALAFAVALAFGAVLLLLRFRPRPARSGRAHVVPARACSKGIFQTGRFLDRHLPGLVAFRDHVLVPIAFAITVPAEAVTSRLDWQTLLRGTLHRIRPSRSRAGSGASGCGTTPGHRHDVGRSADLALRSRRTLIGAVRPRRTKTAARRR